MWWMYVSWSISNLNIGSWAPSLDRVTIMEIEISYSDRRTAKHNSSWKRAKTWWRERIKNTRFRDFVFCDFKTWFPTRDPILHFNSQHFQNSRQSSGTLKTKKWKNWIFWVGEKTQEKQPC